jgi:hypothetical protein
MKHIIGTLLAAALMVGSASIPVVQAGTGSNAPRTESARAADRDSNFDWGWLGLLGLIGLAGLMGRDRRSATSTTANRTSTSPGTTTTRT